MDIFKLLHEANGQNASDLHLVVASPPLVRVQGRLKPVNGTAPMTSESVNECFLQITTPQERELFHQQMELDFNGSISRWSFHTACIDPTAPDDAPCRKNVVVRSFVFF